MGQSIIKEKKVSETKKFTEKYLKGIEPFDNQKRNIKFLVHHSRALLGDKCGGGKTYSSLYSYCYLKEYEVVDTLLVLTPLSAYEKDVWLQDICKFTRLGAISIDEVLKRLKKGKETLEDLLQQYDVVYGKHTHCKSQADLLVQIARRPKTLIVLDEVQAMRNPTSELTIAVKGVCEYCKYIWGITGTSVSKSLEDLYNICNVVYPCYFGNFFQFRNYYCTTKEKIIGRNPKTFRLKKALEITGLKKDKYEEFKTRLDALLISGESFFKLNYHWVDYTLDEREDKLYKKIAKGINLNCDDSCFITQLLSMDENEIEDSVPRVKDVERFSSRFIYLQSAADGVLADNGELTHTTGTKLDRLVELVRTIVERGESGLVYFDYLIQLHAAEDAIKRAGIKCVLLESSGEHTIDASAVSEESCKRIPHIILGTKASSESASYYYMNHVIFFNIPTVPHTFSQMVGRITRKNSLYPDDLNVHIFRSQNIDLYKMVLVSYKAYQLELVQGHEENIPDDYKEDAKEYDFKEHCKRILLWGKFESKR